MRILSGCLMLLVLCTSGCAFCDRCDDFACECRDSYRGYSAWNHWQPVYSGICHEGDFASGFQVGYTAVATRGDTSAPIEAPRKYQTVFYHSEEGQEQRQAWFEGYAHGVVVARQEGVDQWCRTRTATIQQRRQIGDGGPVSAAPRTQTVAKRQVPNRFSTTHRTGIRTANARDEEWKSVDHLTERSRQVPSTLSASGIAEVKDETPDLEDPLQPFAPRFSPSARGE